MVLDLRLTKIGCRETINFFCTCPPKNYKPLFRFNRKLTGIVRVYSLPYISNTVLRHVTRHGRGGRKGYIRYKQIDTMAFSTPPSLRDTSPIANATQRRSLIVDFPLTASSISCGITRYLHPPPLCFAAQNIGGVPAGRGG
mgnify:FL=1